MKIENILIGLILLIFLFDIIRKKNKDSTEEVVNTEVIINKPNWFLSLFILTLIGVFVGLIVDYITNNSFDSNGYFSKNVLEYIKNFRYNDKALINYIFSLLLTTGVGVFIIKTKELNFRTYLLKRKKNITLFIISSILLKLCVHFFIYTSDYRKEVGSYLKPFNNRRIEYLKRDFSWHIDNLFIEKINLFIPAIIICSIIAWFLNDKIKAR